MTKWILILIIYGQGSRSFTTNSVAVYPTVEACRAVGEKLVADIRAKNEWVFPQTYCVESR